QMLHCLLQGPDPLADIMAQVAGEATAAARMRTTPRVDPVTAGHHGGVPCEGSDVFLTASLVRGDTADSHAPGGQEFAAKRVDVAAGLTGCLRQRLPFERAILARSDET